MPGVLRDSNKIEKTRWLFRDQCSWRVGKFRHRRTILQLLIHKISVDKVLKFVNYSGVSLIRGGNSKFQSTKCCVHSARKQMRIRFENSPKMWYKTNKAAFFMKKKKKGYYPLKIVQRSSFRLIRNFGDQDENVHVCKTLRCK